MKFGDVIKKLCLIAIALFVPIAIVALLSGGEVTTVTYVVIAITMLISFFMRIDSEFKWFRIVLKIPTYVFVFIGSCNVIEWITESVPSTNDAVIFAVIVGYIVDALLSLKS